MRADFAAPSIAAMQARLSSTSSATGEESAAAAAWMSPAIAVARSSSSRYVMVRFSVRNAGASGVLAACCSNAEAMFGLCASEAASTITSASRIGFCVHDRHFRRAVKVQHAPDIASHVKFSKQEVPRCRSDLPPPFRALDNHAQGGGIVLGSPELQLCVIARLVRPRRSSAGKLRINDAVPEDRYDRRASQPHEIEHGILHVLAAPRLRTKKSQSYTEFIAGQL